MLLKTSKVNLKGNNCLNPLIFVPLVFGWIVRCSGLTDKFAPELLVMSFG
jgi:hypothetical protein